MAAFWLQLARYSAAPTILSGCTEKTVKGKDTCHQPEQPSKRAAVNYPTAAKTEQPPKALTPQQPPMTQPGQSCTMTLI